MIYCSKPIQYHFQPGLTARIVDRSYGLYPRRCMIYLPQDDIRDVILREHPDVFWMSILISILMCIRTQSDPLPVQDFPTCDQRWPNALWISLEDLFSSNFSSFLIINICHQKQRQGFVGKFEANMIPYPGFAWCLRLVQYEPQSWQCL